MAHMMLLALYHCSCSYDSIVWLCLKIFLFRIAGVFCFDSWFASLVCLRCFSSWCPRLHDIIIIYRFHSEVARLRLWALQMSAICLARELGLRLFVHGSSGSLSLSPGVRATFPIRAINGRMGALASFFHANSAEVPAANSIAVPADDAVAVFHVQHVLGGLPLHQKLLPLPAWHLLLKFGEREHSFCTYIIPHFADKGGVLMYISKQSDEATAWWVHIYLYIYIYIYVYIYTCTVFTQRRSTLILALCNASSGKLAQVRCLFLARLPSLPEKIILQHSGCSSSELKDSRVAPLKHSRRLSSEFRDFCIAPIMLHAEIL